MGARWRPARVPLTIATVPSVPSASTYLALDKGYFRDAGLDVTVERIDSLSKALAFVATNRIQVGAGRHQRRLFQRGGAGAADRHGVRGRLDPALSPDLVHPELDDRIKVPADLKGRSVALSAPGSNAVYEIGMVLATRGCGSRTSTSNTSRSRRWRSALANRRGRRRADGGARSPRSRSSRRSACPGSIPRTVHQAAADDQRRLYRQYRLDQAEAATWRGGLFVALARAGRDYCQAYHRGPNRAEVIDSMVAQQGSSPTATWSSGCNGRPAIRTATFSLASLAQRAGLLQAGGHHRPRGRGRAPGRCRLRGGRGARSSGRSN